MSVSATGLTFQTFATLLTNVKRNVFPEGIAEKVQIPYRSWVGVALSEIQTLVQWYQDFQVRFIQKGDVSEFCSTSVFQGPVGQIATLFAFKPGVDCKKFYYQRRAQTAVDCWMERQRCLCPATVPPSPNIYDSPYCNYVVDGDVACGSPYVTAEEDDLRFKRLGDDQRIFSVDPRFQISCAPRFPCGYILAIQWSGVNRKWENGDLVQEDNLLQDAVEKFVQHRNFMLENQGIPNQAIADEYADSLRMIRMRWREEMEAGPKRDCTAGLEQLLAQFNPTYLTPVYGPGDQTAWLTEDGQPWTTE